MTKYYNLGDLRGAIEDIYREVISEQGNGEAPNAIVLARLKDQRKLLIKHFAPQLTEMALTKLLNEVCQRSAARNSVGSEGDLFEGFSKIPKNVTVARGLKKQTVKLSIAEADEWLSNHSKRPNTDIHDEFRRLIEECRKHVKSDQDTLEAALQRKRGENPTQPNQGFV